MIKYEKGYSLGILVITITVMLILSTTAILSFKSMTKDKDITNFMNDLQEVEEFVKEYYMEKHILPVQYDTNNNPISTNTDEYEEIRKQADKNDAGAYYFVDLNKLERIHLSDYERGYVVNENSLRIYVTKSIIHNGTEYYTVTDEMRGKDRTYSDGTNFEVVISGNPLTWASKAKLILSVPNFETIAPTWTFKYYVPGPITAEEFKDNGKFFIYGETVEITENGVVSFYVENEEGYAKVINVVINKIDDINPKMEITGDRISSGQVTLIDNETGINIEKICYKIKGVEDITNQDGARELYTYGENYQKYIESYNSLTADIQDLKNKISTLDPVVSADEITELAEALNIAKTELDILNNSNQDFCDSTGTPYGDTVPNIVLYVEDYAGNKVSDLEGISRKVLLDSNLITYETKLLNNSLFNIIKNGEYVNSNLVRLRIRSQGATKMLITTDEAKDPKNISNYTSYVSSNGDYEFDLGTSTSGKVTVYAYYTAEKLDENGKLIYEALTDSVIVDKTMPTIKAPKVDITSNLKLTITSNQEDLESGIAKIEYGILANVDKEDVILYKWYSKVSDIENLLENGKSYYIRTRATDVAGNGPVESEYLLLKCPDKKISSIPNAPKIENMQAITWTDSKTNPTEVKINAVTQKDENGVSRIWYDYKMGNGIDDDGESKWANAKTTDGSYFVWIPRYAYKIIYYTDTSKTEIKGYYKDTAYSTSNIYGYYLADGKTLSTEENVKTKYGDIDIVFLAGTDSDFYYDATTKQRKSLYDASAGEVKSDYIVHPAFNSYGIDTTVNSNGNWNRTLTGIWVSKFEASKADATFTSVGSNNAEIKTVPNVMSTTNMKINDAYTLAKNMNTNMSSHLIKNSEWGAVCYLAYSAYGRNGHEIKANLSSNMITGGGTTNSGATYATTSQTIFENRYGYKTEAGYEASTTKNIYGVYDMVGGANEYTASYVANANTVLSNGDNLQKEMYMAQAYSKSAEDTSLENYKINSSVYGDAIGEISKESNVVWNNGKIQYPSGAEPFFTRGGAYSEDAGMFNVGKTDGAGAQEISFRVVLAP